jgi:enolase-phosphatase E1
MNTIRAIVVDIEGTITPISFVRDVLFPFARAHLPGFLQDHADDAQVADEIAAIKAMAPGTDVVQALMGWMDRDVKISPLKALQGLVWRAGYDSGELRGQIYSDVADCLQAWRERGFALYIYSSGSVAAQKLLLGHSDAGDLCPLLSGYFDTLVGGKREAASYQAIAGRIGAAGSECLFLSDIEAELDAALAAGWRTAQLVRAQDGTVGSLRHVNCATLAEVDGTLN